MILHWLFLTLLGHQYFVLGDDTFVCPSDTGVFPHPESDTQFYRCESGKPALQDCATGTFDAGKGACSEDQAANSTSTASPKPANNDNKTTSKTSPSSAETTTTTTSKADDTKVKSDEKSTATAKPASDADSTTQKSASTAKPGTKKAKKDNETVKDSTTPSTTTTTPSITTTTKSSKGDDSSSTDKKTSQGETQKTQDETQKPKAETFRAEAEYDYNYDYSDDYRTYGEEHQQPAKTETETDHAQHNQGHGDHAQQNEGHGDHAQQNEGHGDHAWQNEGHGDDAQQNEGLGNHGDHGDHVQQNDGHGDHSKVEEKFNCPNESGFYRHPANCSRFFWCIQWQPTPMFCAEGTAFDPDNHVCSWIVGSDGCGGQLAAPGYQDSHHSFDRLKRSVTDDVKDFDDVNFVPDNYKLSPRHRRQASDYDYYYDSDDGHSNKDGDRRDGPKEGRSFGLDSKDVNFGAGSATTPYQCPGDGFYADPHDCTVFYHCANGKPYRHQCQPGTAFNKDKYVCSWPLEADGCGGMLSVPYQADVQADDENFSNPFTIEDKEDSGFECPDDVNGYYPDPTDCRHFFQCVEAQKFRHKCANGTAFNIESGVCTWPMSAKSGCGVVLYRAEVEADHPQKALGHKKHHKKHAGHPSDRKRRSLPSWASGALFRMADDPEGKKQQAASPKAAEKKQENKKAESSAQTKTDASTDTEAKKSEDKSNSGSKLAEESSKSASSDKAKTSTSSTTTTASTPPTTTTTTTTAPGTKTDKVEPLPGVVDSIQRTSAWPWESVVRKRKQKSRADYITTKAPSKTTTTQTTDKKSSSSSSTTTTVKSATTKKNTTPKASTTSSTTMKPTTTTTTTTTKAPEPSTLAVKHPKAEAYRVSTAETDFRCPAPTGHFRDPMNCAIYYHCVDDVAFRKECPDGNLYDINFHRCLPINEVKDCRLVDEKKVGREDEWLSHYPESNSYPKKVDGPREFECDVLNGYFRNHEDCSAYVECLDGVAFHRKCMTGTVFDATRKKCTWSSLVPDCRVTSGSEASEEKNYQVDGFQCPTTDGYYRDPASCSTYYHCIDGKAMPRVCDPNNFFDPQASQCRWAKLVTDCDDRGLPVYVDKLPVSKFVCPLPNGHYRDPEDCSVFYHCLQDVPYRGACRRHHAFDVDLLTCVPRSEVSGCKQNHVTEEKDVWGKQEARKVEGARGVSQGLTTTVETVDTRSDSTTRKSSNGDFQCPEAHGLFRDPQDCRVFYHCFSGRHFRHECQFGTVFSTERNLCTWPALVPDCPLATQSPEVTSQDAQDNIESTEEWISDNLPADFRHDHQHDAPAPSRPSKSTTTPRVVTKKTDVTKSRDDVTKSPSDVIEVQDDVSEAQPYISQEVNSAAEIEPFDYDQGEVHTPKASSDGLNNFIVEAAVPNGFRSDPFNEFICPQLIFDQYFRDPIDCTRFHRCVKGLRFTFDCPRGTFFDPVFNICDFQEKVPDCDHEGRRLGTSREPMGSDNEVSIPLYTGNGGEYMTENSLDFPVADPMCPRSDGLFPHPSSCNKFVYCARGSPVVLTCPADLLYNVDTMTCDYQDKIVCIHYDK